MLFLNISGLEYQKRPQITEQIIVQDIPKAAAITLYPIYERFGFPKLLFFEGKSLENCFW